MHTHLFLLDIVNAEVVEALGYVYSCDLLTGMEYVNTSVQVGSDRFSYQQDLLIW